MATTWKVRTRRLMAFPDLADEVAKDIVQKEHKLRHKPAVLNYLNGKIENWDESSKPKFVYYAVKSTKKGGGVIISVRIEGGPIQKLRWEQIDKGAPGGQNIVRKTFLSTTHNIYQKKKGREAKAGRGRPSSFSGIKSVVRGRPTGPLKSQQPYLGWNYYEPSKNGKPGYFTSELRIRRTTPYTAYELHRDKRRESRPAPAPITRGPVRARNYTQKLTEVYFGSTTGQDDPDLQNPALVGRNIARTAYSRWLRKIKEGPLVELK